MKAFKQQTLRLIDSKKPKGLNNIQWGRPERAVPTKVHFQYDPRIPYGKVFGSLIFNGPHNYRDWEVTCTACWGIFHIPFPEEGETPWCRYCGTAPEKELSPKQRRAARQNRYRMMRRSLGTNEPNVFILTEMWEEAQVLRLKEEAKVKYEQTLRKIDANNEARKKLALEAGFVPVPL